MSLDIYTTARLNAIVPNLKTPQSFLLDKFFTQVSQSEEEIIYFDVEPGVRRMAPFVSPLVEGKLVEGQGFTTSNFTPAYIKDKRVFDPKKPLRRAIGEQIGGKMSAADRAQLNLVRELLDQTQMLTRRLEWMGAQSLIAGQYTVSGEGFKPVNINFGRDASLTIQLAGGNTWNWGTNPNVTPDQNISDWCLTVLQKSGAVITDIVFDPTAWKQLKQYNDKSATKFIDLARAKDVDINLDPLLYTPKKGGQFMGTMGMLRLWVYADWYTDSNGTEQPMLPANTVIGCCDDLMGVRHFGAIADEEADFQAVQMWAKSWLKKDPAQRLLLMQSAPLVVPYRPNASFCATVQ